MAVKLGHLSKCRTVSLPVAITVLLLASLTLSACQPLSAPVSVQPTATLEAQSESPNPQSTPLPTRPVFQPGELVDYVAQTGDTLPALAAHFNTTVDEIRAANPIIPPDATTMPPGMPMKMPIYYAPLWGSAYQILPDSLFVNGPAQVGFDSRAFVAAHPGWLKEYTAYAANANRSGAEIVELVSRNFSVSPRLLLALLEYQAGALSQPELSPEVERYPLGYVERAHKGLYLQLVWAANTLNNGYYGWRSGDLRSLTHADGTLERPDPWQNAATVALQVYFDSLLSPDDYRSATGPDGFAQTYRDLFGDPWADEQAHIPGSLAQPEFRLPFEVGKKWALTGGPHTGWGAGAPWAALDFAPPTVVGGCVPTQEWATAVAPGVVARSETGVVVLDLDGDLAADGDERTGWVVFYLHIGTEGRARVGDRLKTSDPIGHPSCEGGSSTGTHIHIARKYNGEWMLAEGALAFDLEGWKAYNGSQAYQGGLKRYSRTVVACVCSNAESQIEAGER